MADLTSSVTRQYRDYTRYLRPVRSVSFTDIEMLQSVVQCLDPEDVASVAQLLGTRRGVVRITMKTIDGVARLEDAVRRRRLTVAGSPLGIVEDGGQFVVVTLDNVPHYVTDEQVRACFIMCTTWNTSGEGTNRPEADSCFSLYANRRKFFRNVETGDIKGLWSRTN